MALTREQILAANNVTKQEVPVPEWGGSVFIKVMSAKQRESWENSFDERKAKGTIRTDLLVRTICDETGRETLTHSDIDALGEKDSTIVDSLFDKAREINKLRKEDVKALGNDSPPTP